METNKQKPGKEKIESYLEVIAYLKKKVGIDVNSFTYDLKREGYTPDQRQFTCGRLRATDDFLSCLKGLENRLRNKFN